MRSLGQFPAVRFFYLFPLPQQVLYVRHAIMPAAFVIHQLIHTIHYLLANVNSLANFFWKNYCSANKKAIYYIYRRR
nr:MAG TPA: Somatostatin/Cortistatin family [Caudoviricetes sp.]